MAAPLIGVGVGIALRVGGRFALRAGGKALKFLGGKALGLLKAAVPAAVGRLVMGGLKLGASGIGNALSAIGAVQPFGLLGAVAGAVSGEGSAQAFGAESVGLRGHGRKAMPTPG